MDGRRGTGQVVDLVHVDEDRLGHIVPDHLEILKVEQMLDVLAAAGEEVVETDDVRPLGQEALAQVGPEEAGTAGNQNSHVGPEPMG